MLLFTIAGTGSFYPAFVSASLKTINLIYDKAPLIRRARRRDTHF